MRNIDDSIWRDEWFAAQDLLGRLLWLGIISRVADDQGRFLDNAELIKSDVFPMDKISADEIDSWITFFCVDGKVVRYVAGGKKLVQIVNWWRYQASSSWMGKSKYQAPEGWQDFWRFHSTGHKIEVSENWPLRNALPSALLIKEEEDNDKEEEEDKADVETPAPASPDQKQAGQYFVNAGYSEANKTLLAASGLAAIPSGENTRLDQAYALITAHTQEKTLDALKECRAAWVKTPKKPGNGGGFYSVLNFGWVDWASELLSTGVRHWETKKPEPDKPIPEVLTEDTARFVPPPKHLKASRNATTT